MSFLETSKIAVFPSTRRFNTQVSARLLSESSLISLVNKLIDTDGFVITPDDETTGYIDTSITFEFNIHGYYFMVDRAQDIIDLFSSSNTTEIYGNIYLDTVGNYTELKGQDVEVANVSRYQGVTFSAVDLSDASQAASASEDQADYSLLLFTRESAASSLWEVPVESRIKFNSGFALGIDGGEI